MEHTERTLSENGLENLNFRFGKSQPKFAFSTKYDFLTLFATLSANLSYIVGKRRINIKKKT